MTTPMTRRAFLERGLTAAGALAGLSLCPAASAAGPRKLDAKADAVILLWMAGGQAHTETWDPKKHTPYEPGLEAKKVLSTFKSIPTSVDGLRISEALPHMARVMHEGTLIKTFRPADLGHILHSRHQYHFHTGYVPPIEVKAPSMGAVMARALGSRAPGVPAYIDIGQRFDVSGGESFEVKAFHTAGFLGDEFGPFQIPDPAKAMEAVAPPAGMSRARFEERRRRYQKLLLARAERMDMKDGKRTSFLRSVDSAHEFLSSPAAKAFDLSSEPKESYDAYDTSRFGLGCLLARRLVEAGARFLEVTTEYIPFQGWDTHENGHSRTAKLCEEIDRPMARLITDLKGRGLLSRTLIIVASEFSRDMLTEGKPEKPVTDQVVVPNLLTEEKHYGMHRHFTGASSVLLFGGGVKEGHVYGRTADERPPTTVEKPVSVDDLNATIYRAVGIPADLSFEIESRPFFVTKDGKGKVVEDIFA